MSNYRQTANMLVCSPTNRMDDARELLRIAKSLKSAGAKLPPQIETLLEAAQGFVNAEDAMNAACNGLFRFYLSEEVRCAKKAGYKSLDDYLASKAKGNSDEMRDFERDDCILRTMRQWQWHNVNYTINPFNSDSAISEAMARYRDQVFGIAGKWIKKQVKSKTTSKPPEYERPPLP